jgi:hypothetical protein
MMNQGNKVTTKLCVVCVCVCVCVAICSVGSCVKTEFPNREIFIIFPYEGYISFFSCSRDGFIIGESFHIPVQRSWAI